MEPSLPAVLLLLAAFLGHAAAADFPAYIMRCSIKDPKLNECFNRAANDAIQKLKSGVPSLGVPALDPLVIPRISIQQTGDQRIALNLLFENVKFYNVSRGTAKVKLDLKNNQFGGTFMLPHVKMISDYEVNGKVLVVPVRGKGKAYIDIYGSKAEFTVKVAPKVIKGKSYYTLDSLNYHVIGSEGMKMMFTNLLGNRALGESVNEVLNENWQELYETVRPSFEKVFRQYFYDLGQRVFNKVPSDQIFPERL